MAINTTLSTFRPKLGITKQKAQNKLAFNGRTEHVYGNYSGGSTSAPVFHPTSAEEMREKVKARFSDYRVCEGGNYYKNGGSYDEKCSVYVADVGEHGAGGGGHDFVVYPERNLHIYKKEQEERELREKKEQKEKELQEKRAQKEKIRQQAIEKERNTPKDISKCTTNEERVSVATHNHELEQRRLAEAKDAHTQKLEQVKTAQKRIEQTKLDAQKQIEQAKLDAQRRIEQSELDAQKAQKSAEAAARELEKKTQDAQKAQQIMQETKAKLQEELHQKEIARRREATIKAEKERLAKIEQTERALGKKRSEAGALERELQRLKEGAVSTGQKALKKLKGKR